jgi:hypothetical protein
MAKHKIVASYNNRLFDPPKLKKLAENTCETLRKLKKTVAFDAIAFRGTSM